MIGDGGEGFDRVIDEMWIERRFAIEQRLADHVDRQAPHFRADVDNGAVLKAAPACDACIDGREQMRHIFGQRVGMKCRLLDRTHLLPQRAIHRNHGAPEDRRHAFKIFAVIGAVGGEHLLELLRRRQQKYALRTHLQRNAAAAVARDLQKQRQRIAGVLQHRQLRPDAARIIASGRLRFIQHVHPGS